MMLDACSSTHVRIRRAPAPAPQPKDIRDLPVIQLAISILSRQLVSAQHAIYESQRPRETKSDECTQAHSRSKPPRSQSGDGL